MIMPITNIINYLNLKTMPGIIWNLLGGIFEFLIDCLDFLFATVIVVVGAVLDFVADVTNWLIGVEDEIREAGGTQVNVIDGGAFATFIGKEKEKGNVKEISYSQLRDMRNSVINVAMNDNGEVVYAPQMMKGESVSPDTKKQFGGKPVVQINL